MNVADRNKKLKDLYEITGGIIPEEKIKVKSHNVFPTQKLKQEEVTNVHHIINTSNIPPVRQSP